MLPQNWQAEFAESLMSEHPSLEGVHPISALPLYKKNHDTHLIQALKTHYPLILKMLGTELFTSLAKAYLEQYPSGSSSTHDYGAYFTNFLTEHEPVQHLIYLAELAEFEWASHEIELAADAPALTLPARDGLRTKNHDHLYFVFHPATRLMKCHYPILHIMQSCQAESVPDINKQTNHTMLLLHRHDTVTFTILDTADFIFLNRLYEGYSLSEAKTQTEMISPLYPFMSKLEAWMDDHIIVEINQL